MIVGSNAANNNITVMGGGALWNVGGGNLTVGGAGGSNNTVVVAGNATLANVGAIDVGAGTAGASFNQLILTNGGQLVRSGAGMTRVGGDSTLGTASRSNTVIIVGGTAAAVWNNGGNELRVGDGQGAAVVGNNQLFLNGNGSAAVLTNVSLLEVGNNETGDSLLLTNGAQLFTTGLATIGNGTTGNNANNNLVSLAGGSAGSGWNLAGGALVIGSAVSGQATSNTLLVGAGGLVTNLSVTVGVGAARSNTLVVQGGQVWATSLVATSAGNAVVLNAGLLASGGTVYSNGLNFVVGDGVDAATFQLTGGTHTFQNNLIVTNAGVLSGVGQLTVNNGAGQTVIASGGVLSPGSSSPGGLTNVGALVVSGGGSYLWQINDFNGTAGAATGWDLVQVVGSLTNTGPALNPFTIAVNSLTAGNVGGLVTNFNKDSSYAITIASASGGVASFDPTTYALNLAGFANPWDGVWSLLAQGNNLVLNYQGATNFVWDDVSGAFSNSSPVGLNWLGNAAPPVNTTNLVLTFGGTGSDAYTASNDITGLVAKRLVLTNSAAATQSIIGNAITLAGVAPDIQQNGPGSFVISNNLVLANNLTFDGTNAGLVEVDGTISGAYSLIKTGSYTLVLGGVNSYTGQTVIAQGQLVVANAGALSNSVVNNQLTGGLGFSNLTAATIGGLTGTTGLGLTNLAGAGLALTLNTGGWTYGGTLSGSGSLTKGGTGPGTLSGTNTYTGDTLVSGGVLTVSGTVASANLLVTGGQFNWANSGALTNAVAVTVTSGGTVNFATSGTIDALTGTGNVTVNSNTLQVGFNNATTNFAGAVTGAGTLSKVGAGTWTLTGTGNNLGNVAVTSGTLALGGGSLLATNLAVTTGGQFALNSGTLTVATASLSNGADFVVGTGRAAANFTVLAGGTAWLQQGLLVSSNATLAGAGAVTVGSGAVTVGSGASLAPTGPGNAPANLTVNGTLLLASGGQYLFNVADFTGPTPGVNWDLLTVNGLLSNAATALAPFAIDVLPIGGANFNRDGNYSLTLATATSGLSALNLSAFNLVLTNLPANDGIWSLVTSGTSLVLNYEGITNYVWQNTSGQFSTAGQWANGNAPVLNTTNIVLTFGGTASQAYTATNDLAGLTAKRIVLTNSATVAQYITGNAITLAGVAPELQQNGTGGFVISNNLVLASNLTVAGTNTGTVELDGTISGTASLTKTGSDALVLGGSNTYSGSTLINQGQLVVANGNALRNSTVSNMVNGGLTFSNLTAANVAGLTGTGNLGLTNLAGTSLALTLTGGGTYNGALSGSGSLTKSGTGTEILTGANTYTGDTLVNGAVLTVTGTLASTNLIVTGGQFNWANPGALTNAVAVTVTSGGTVNLATDGTLDALTGTGNVTVNSNTLQVGFNNATTNFAGAVTGAGTLTKAGTGTWTLTGAGNALGNVAVTSGTLALGGGSLTTTNLAVTVGGQFALNTGTLTVNQAGVSNGADFVVGNGSGPARFTVVGGPATFQNNLLVTNAGATLAGTGTLIANGALGVVVQGGGVIAPGAGAGPATLTTVGTLSLGGGGQYQWDINSTAGTAGGSTGWDWLQVVGRLTNAAPSGNPFVIDITSLTAGNAAGALADFNRDGNYNFTIATASGGLSTNALALNFSGFANAFDGTWSLAVVGGTNLMLDYVGLTNFTWTDVSGRFSSAAQWQAGAVPPTGATNLVLVFGGAATSSYTASNDLTGLLTKQLSLTNNAAVTQYIVGNSFTLAGTAPVIAQNGSGSFVISNAVSLGNNVTLTGTGTGTLTLAGGLGGAGNLTQAGAATVVLSGNNTNSGLVIVTSGTLQLGDGGTSGSFGTGPVTNNAQLVLARGDAYTIGNLLAGTGTVSVANGGTVTLSGNNTFTGNLNVNNGAVVAVAANSFGSGPKQIIATNAGNVSTIGLSNNVTLGANLGFLVSNSATGIINLAGNNTLQGVVALAGDTALVAANGGLTVAGAVTNASANNQNLLLAGSATGTIAGAIADGGPAHLAVVKNDPGTWLLTGTNTYSGATLINSGTLQVGANGTGGTLGTGDVTNNANLVFRRSDTASVTNLITGTGPLSQSGSGTTVLATNDTYTGATLINSGTLQVGAGGTAGTLGTGAVSNNSQLAFNRRDNLTVANAIAGTGTLAQNGAGVVTLTATNSYTGATVINAGALVFGQGLAATNSTVTVNAAGGLGFGSDAAYLLGGLAGAGNFGLTNATGAVTVLVGNNNSNTTYAGTLSGAGALTKLGSGTLTLSGTNTYTGDTTVSNGTLTVTGQAGGLNLGVTGGQFNWAGATALTNLATATLSRGGTLNFQTSGTLAAVTGPGALTVSGTSTGAVGFGGASSSFAGTLTGSGALAKLGAGTWTLTGLGNALNSVVVNGGTLALSGGQLTATNLTVAGGQFALNTGTLTVNQATINGADFVVGNGTGPAQFTIVGGTATVQNNLVVTNTGAVLAGNGTLAAGGPAGVLVQGGGVLAPGVGAAPAQLTTTGTLTLGGGGQYVWDVNALADNGGTAGGRVGWDFLQVNGRLANPASSSNPFVIDITSLTAGNTAGALAGFSRDGNYSFTIATASSGLAPFDASAYALNLTGFANAYDGTWSLAVAGGTNLLLNYVGDSSFVWNNVSGAFGTNSNWQGNAAPTVGATNVMLFFGGTAGQAYTASNGLTGLITKRIGLTNSAAATQYITGNAITFAGLAPDLEQNGTGGFVISNNLTLASATTVTGTGTGVVELDGVISGPTSLTKTGAFALVLGGANTFSGPTVIQQGPVVVANAAALANSLVNNQTAGGLVFSNLTAATLGGLTGAVELGLTNTTGAGVALTLAGTGWTYGGTLSGSGSLTRTGTGTGTLSGNSTYTGATLVNGATLVVNGTLASTNLSVTGGQFTWANPAALPNAVAVTVASGGTVSFATAGTIDALTGTGAVAINGNTLQVGFNNATTNFAGTVSGAGTLAKAGTGTWTLTGNSALGNVAVANGTLALTGGRLTTTNLFVTTGGNFALNSGTLTVGTAAINNGADFVVGDGASAATFHLLGGGTATFQNNLVVSSNATLLGTGNFVVGGAVIIQNGATQAIGGAPGTQTVTGTNLWQGGGQFTWDVNNFGGAQGRSSGWDWLNVLGTLTNAATTANPFVINVTSLAGSSAGLAAGFDYNANYSLVIATGTTLANLATNALTLNTTGFQNSFDGIFQLAVQGTNLVLKYTGLDQYTWLDSSGNFSDAGSWINGAVPTISHTNVALYFGGSTTTGYTANNDLTGLLTKRVGLSNATTTVQTIAGNPFTFAGLDPELDQQAAGAFVISNNVALESTLTAAGSGAGTVTLAGDVSGLGSGGSITKAGTWTLVLGGSNTYSGTTVVQDGHLFIANSYGLSGSTLSNLVPGAVVFTNNLTSAYLGGLAGTVDLGLTNTAGTSLALTVGGNNQNSTYSGTLSGAGSLTKAGSGTLTLSGINTYSGATVVNAGTLVAGVLANGIGGSGSSLGSGNQILITGGTLRFGAGTLLAVTNPPAGSLSLNGGTLNAASLLNLGHVANLGNTSTIDADFTNAAFLDATNGTVVTLGAFVNATTGLITNSANLKVGATGLGWMTNAGRVVLADGSLAAGTINNRGTISGHGTLATAIQNTGLVSATESNQLLTIAGAATGSGAYRADAGATLSFAGGGQLSNLFNTNATIRIAGGILTNLSAFNNAGTLAIAGGTYQALGTLNNNSNAWLTGYGTVSAASHVVNAGTLAANLGSTNAPLVIASDLLNTATGLVRADASALQVTGVFTNNGTLQFISSVGTYSRTVVDNGAWSTETSASVFSNNFIITTNGYVSASYGSKYIFTADLLNQSTNNLHWDTLGVVAGTNTTGTGTEFLFSGTSLTQTQTFAHPGLLLTGGFVGSPANPTTGVQTVDGYADGFSNNFAVGQLWLTNTTLVIEQTPGNTLAGGLFVNDLDLFGAAHLVISNNMTVYFVNSNAWSLAEITLLGNAQIHQLTGLGALLVIPEPNVLLMWLCGGLTVWAARRRRNRHQNLS